MLDAIIIVNAVMMLIYSFIIVFRGKAVFISRDVGAKDIQVYAGKKAMFFGFVNIFGVVASFIYYILVADEVYSFCGFFFVVYSTFFASQIVLRRYISDDTLS